MQTCDGDASCLVRASVAKQFSGRRRERLDSVRPAEFFSVIVHPPIKHLFSLQMAVGELTITRFVSKKKKQRQEKKKLI